MYARHIYTLQAQMYTYVYGSLVMLITAVALQLSGRRVWVKDDSVCGKDTVRIKDVKTGQLHLRM